MRERNCLKIQETNTMAQGNREEVLHKRERKREKCYKKYFFKGVDKENLYKLLLRSSRTDQEGNDLKLRNVVHIFTLRFNKTTLYVL